MSFSTASRQRVGPVLSLASMVDVMFLLLIFFMTASVFRDQERQIDVNLPAAQAADAGAAANTQIVITVAENGTIYMAQREYSLDALKAALLRLAQAHPNEAVIVRGDQESRLGMTVAVIDAAYAAGLRNVSIASIDGQIGGGGSSGGS